MSKLLNGIKVVELAGLAPVPHCGMILADFGAHVTVVDKSSSGAFEQRMTRGKHTVHMDLRKPEDIAKVKAMCKASDVLLDPYRPGALEKMGLDPVDLLKENEGLIVCRISGYGQTGPMKDEAGHDLNYVAMSGLLPVLAGRNSKRPWPPINLLADFAGGSLTSAFGIVAALTARERNGGKGCVIDCSMTEGVSYLASFIQTHYDIPHLFSADYGAFTGECPIYRTYSTKDEKFVAVAGLEPKFHQKMFTILGIDGDDLFTEPEKIVKLLENKFLTKTRDEWASVFEGQDACVTPVLDINEVGDHKLHKDRNSYEYSEKYHGWVSNPAPRISTLEDLLKLKKSKL